MDDTGHRPTTGPASTVVVVPVYQPELSPGEASLVRATISAVLHPVFMAPLNLPLPFYENEFPEVPVVLTDPRHLSSVRNYSEWLTTPEFYDLWSDYDWLIICQTDAVLVEDPWSRILAEPNWDYVGAPWNPPIKVATLGSRILVRSPSGHTRGPAWVGMVGRSIHVGNGGLSMRRVSSFRHAARTMTSTLSLQTRQHIHEDVLWATFGPRFGVRIASPSVARGLFHEIDGSRNLNRTAPLPNVVGYHGVTSWPLEEQQEDAR